MHMNFTKPVHYNLLLLIFFCITACSTNENPPLKDFSNTWEPANSFSETITPIPLFKKYHYRVLTIDSSLKSLLNRWASDNGSRLTYGHCYDYTIPSQALSIDALTLEEALVSVNTIYQNSGITITQDQHNGIIVQEKPNHLKTCEKI